MLVTVGGTDILTYSGLSITVPLCDFPAPLLFTACPIYYKHLQESDSPTLLSIHSHSLTY